ncbi:DNA polymerase III subunit epsilon [Roseomonas elaeocarpi]|uniref:DNA polymerase III subunit epsilon n=1 Tax=Roseomonas elaeocarpi TaxID=907779 RepID=A0ABV6JQS8_9PROT
MQPIYVVTDTEFDGPVPGRNSLLSIGAAAVDEHGTEVGCFEAVLQPLPEASADPGTLRWFATEPEAWAAATRDPQPAEAVMRRFAGWVRSLPGDPVFAAHPVAVDAAWIDHYLLRFTGDRVMPVPRAEAPLFHDAPLCLHAFAAGRLGWPPHRCRAENYPAEWLGQYPHNHRALDDARGYGRLLARLLGSAPAG